jgi:hypothetical protein
MAAQGGGYLSYRLGRETELDRSEVIRDLYQDDVDVEASGAQVPSDRGHGKQEEQNAPRLRGLSKNRASCYIKLLCAERST